MLHICPSSHTLLSYHCMPPSPAPALHVSMLEHQAHLEVHGELQLAALLLLHIPQQGGEVRPGAGVLQLLPNLANSARQLLEDSSGLAKQQPEAVVEVTPLSALGIRRHTNTDCCTGSLYLQSRPLGLPAQQHSFGSCTSRQLLEDSKDSAAQQQTLAGMPVQHVVACAAELLRLLVGAGHRSLDPLAQVPVMRWLSCLDAQGVWLQRC